MIFEEFEKKFKVQQIQMSDAMAAFPWENRMGYAGWLANTYHYVLNSTRILALAAGYMPNHMTQLSNRFIAHAAEEKGHEQLLVRDVKALDFKMEQIPVTTEMKMYYRSLYSWVSGPRQPEGLLGWVLSLESLAANIGPIVYARALKAFGPKAGNFLKVHSDADPDHLEKAIKACRGLSESELDTVFEAVEVYSQQYIKMMDVLSQSNKTGKKVA